MRLTINFKFCCISLVLVALSGLIASAQENTVWDKPALRDSITELLSNYQVLHNKLNSEAEPSVERAFIHLFSNPKIQVVNDLEDKTKPVKMSIDDYVVKIGELFPDGLIIHLDLARLSFEQPKYDRNSRYIIRIRVNRELKGISNGKVYSSNQKVIFKVAFFFSNNAPVGFTLYGMELPSKGQSFMSITVSPALTGFLNSTLRSDERFSLGQMASFKGGVNYSYYFSDHWGVGSGAQFSQYSGKLKLNKFDALGGFDPHLSDVQITNDLWFVEVPLFLSYRTNPSKRWELRADAGISFGYRLFETMSSSAINQNTGITLVNVITDTEWISKMNRLDLGLQGMLSLRYKINNHMGIIIGGGLRQGLSDLDNNTRTDFGSSKYLGQFNPLWGASGKTVSQAFFLNLGVSALLNKERN